MSLYRIGWIGVILACKVIGAEVSPQQCARGDSACYTQQHARACSIRNQATPESCLEWIGSLEDRASSGDRAALRAQADAYGYLATLLTRGDGVQVNSAHSAIKKYRELLSTDSQDVGAMGGIATLTEDTDERIQLLRDVVRLNPHPISVNALLDALRNLDTTASVLEAAMVADDIQRTLEGGMKWVYAAQAYKLYLAAGEAGRASALRQGAREELAVPAVLRELSANQAASPDRAVQLLDSICHPQVARTIGAQPCLDALEVVVPSLGKRADRREAQRLADRIAAIIWQLTNEAGLALAESDPDWHPRVMDLLDSIPAQGLGSLATWMMTSRVDREPAGRSRALEQAVSIAPDNASLLAELALAYWEQERRDEALAFYRRAKAVTPLDRVNEQRELERLIQAIESK